jgi:fatty-acyl-CoA synthase
MSDSDRFISWLPLFHDMGLVGFFLCPMLLNLDLVIMDTTEFIRRPTVWMETAAEFGGTIIGAPNFAYALAAKRRIEVGASSLQRVRLAFNGSEPVDRSTVEHFQRQASGAGFSAKAMYPVYGMAEATLGISFPAPGTGVTFDAVNSASLEIGSEPQPSNDMTFSLNLAHVGRPLEGVSVRVCDPKTGLTISEGAVGELQIRGETVISHYWDSQVRESFAGEWLRTGDLGYLSSDEIVVAGRLKDQIIIAGVNVDPHAVEVAAGSLPYILRGSVAAFGVDKPTSGTEGIVVIAEWRRGQVRTDGIHRQQVAAAVMRECGYKVEEVVLVGPGELPKTTSGKVQRRECKARFIAGEYE